MTTERTDPVSEDTSRLKAAEDLCHEAGERLKSAISAWCEANNEFRDALKCAQESRGVHNHHQRRARQMNNPARYDHFNTHLLRMVAAAHEDEARKLMELAQ